VRCHFKRNERRRAPSANASSQTCTTVEDRASRAWASRVGGANLPLLLETIQRSALNRAILEELSSLSTPTSAGRQAAGGVGVVGGDSSAPLVVHVSDVDELLDPRLWAEHAPKLPSCTPVHLRLFVYSEHCPLGSVRWQRSVLARANWLVPLLQKQPDLELRMVHESAKELVSHGCLSPLKRLPTFGVHLSYFFETRDILRKLDTFHHAGDWKILKTTKSRDPAASVDWKVRSCTPVSSDVPYAALSALRNGSYDSRATHKANPDLLPVRGWPRHSFWSTPRS
jgi:hypothetical protein